MSQLLNQMDNYLSNQPFKRQWWSRPWIFHMVIQPPLCQASPLWKRSQEELRLLRLFDVSPEELGREIERYWKKPRWRRWFAYFGMKKKIDVWNYYQRCLAYQAVRPEKLEPRSMIVTHPSDRLLNELSLVLHRCNVKFEQNLEKRCCNSSWDGKQFLKEINRYKQQLRETFVRKLNKSLQQIKIEGERCALKQQAELEYQQVEVFMLRYYRRWLNNFLFHRAHAKLVEIGIDVAEEGDNPEYMLAISANSQAISSFFQADLAGEVNHQHRIRSLDRAKTWVQTQRQRLNSLIEEGSLQKVEELLQSSLHEITVITSLYLERCEISFYAIEDEKKAYDTLNYLDRLQCRLKCLLQRGKLLFHPDHVQNVTHTQVMWELITRYSQSYLAQSQCYLERLKKFYLHIEVFSRHLRQALLRRQLCRDYVDLARRIQQLAEPTEELQQSFKEIEQALQEFAQRAQELKKMEAQLKEPEARRMQDLQEMEAQLKKAIAQRVQYLMKVQRLRQELKEREAQLKELKAQLKESEAQRMQDKKKMEAQLKELEAQHMKWMEARQAQHMKWMEAQQAQINELRDLITSQLSVSSSTSSAVQMQESSNNARFFRH